MIRRRQPVCALLVLLCALFWPRAGRAWTADQPWRTVETEHFRVHYPLDNEAWALDMAGRLDEIRARVATVVGYAPDRKVDLVLMDPFSDANGFAMALARQPLMGVFPSPPSPASGIGHYRLWAEDLVTHEDVHLVHMLRPSRNPWRRFFGETVLGTRPIAWAPAWVIEGYATLVEGQLTGAGRPHSDGRAAWLRELARQGQLPTYWELDGSWRWRSGGMRYLVGSAFLEWLEAREGPTALPDLWARMTAREGRSFSEAFEGVFGDSPSVLYGRFAAELTAGALALERPASHNPVLFLDLEGDVGAPAVSPTGGRVALVVYDRAVPELVVYETGIDESAITEREEAEKALLEADPEDVPAVEPKADPHAELARRKHRGGVPRGPRWVDDRTLLFSLWRATPRGEVVPDLFTWEVETGRQQRVTRGANLREASPCGGRAIAVHRQDGASHLVEVDLATGAITEHTAPSPTRVDAWPRQDDACEVLAWLENTGAWTVVVQANGDTRRLTTPEGGQPLALDVRPDGGGVLVALGLGGFVDLWEWERAANRWVRRSAGNGGVFAPDVTTDGTVFALTEAPDGYDLVTLSGQAELPNTVDHGVILTDLGWTRGAERPPPSDAPPLPSGTAPAPQRYGLGPQRARLMGGSQALAAPTSEVEVDVGAVLSDRAGRSELVLLAGLLREDAGVPVLSGARAAWTWRRLRVHPRAEAWWLDGATPVLGGGGALTHHRAGRLAGRSELSAFADNDAWGATLRLSERPSTVAGRVGLRAEADLVGQAGSNSLGRLGLGGAVTLGGWTLRVRGDQSQAWRGALVLGGLQRGLDPSLRTAHHLWMPTLPTRSLEAQVGSATAEVRAVGEVLGLGATRLGPGGVFGLPPTAWTALHLDARGEVAAQPLLQIAGLSLQGGIACRVETPAGFALSNCLALDGWSGWASVRVVPGRPPGFP